MSQIVTIDCGTGKESTRPLTTEEQADADARAVTEAQRVQTEATGRTNRGTLEQQALAALAANKTYIGRASPTAAQQTAQIRALSQQANGIIRLLLNRLDATD